LEQACQRYIKFALDHPYAYEALFDGVARPPSLHEPWPSFNLFRTRLALRLGGDPRQYTRLMLALWSLMHGTAMLIIRGSFEGVLRAQVVHACVDAFEAIIAQAEQSKSVVPSAPRWPSNLTIGEGPESHAETGAAAAREKRASKKLRAKSKRR
jgi:hypothetical protein